MQDFSVGEPWIAGNKRRRRPGLMLKLLQDQSLLIYKNLRLKLMVVHSTLRESHRSLDFLDSGQGSFIPVHYISLDKCGCGSEAEPLHNLHYNLLFHHHHHHYNTIPTQVSNRPQRNDCDSKLIVSA
jgi:hypothetical protein